MEIKYNTGKERKSLVNAVSEILGERAEYLGAPTFGYRISECCIITREGNLDIDDGTDSEEMERLIDELYKRGFIAANMAELELIGCTKDDEDEKVGFSIGIPVSKLSDKPCTGEVLERFNQIVSSKKALFQKALGTTHELETALDIDTLWFDWFDSMIDNEHMEIYSEFIKAVYKMAENAVRVTAKEKPIENEKFAMRTFLNRIGLLGKEYKPLRKELMKNLSGDGAFRYGRPDKTNTDGGEQK